MSKIIEEDLSTLNRNLSEFKDSISGKTFLVTGGAGFLGSWFCDVLDSFGAKTICLDNLSSGSKKNIQYLIGRRNFTFVNEEVLNYEPKEKLDYIVHMASIASPPIYTRFPIETLDVNTAGTKKLLEIARKNKIKGFLFTSTSEIYGNIDDANIPTKETYYGNTNSFGPRSMYDEGKRAAEAYCYSYHKKFQMPVRISRTFNTFGPRLDVESTSQYGRAIIKFLHQALKNEPLTVYQDGNQTRSFCYITDQIEGLFKLLLTQGLDGELVNIGNPAEFKIIDLAKAIIHITGSKSKIIVGANPNYDLKDDPKRRCPDITKAKEILGFSPKVELDDGLKRMVKWLRDTGVS